MRKAELAVYDGVPFCQMSGRKKAQDLKKKMKKEQPIEFYIAMYWHTKIHDLTRKTMKNQWQNINFAFNKKELEYYKDFENNLEVKVEPN